MSIIIKGMEMPQRCMDCGVDTGLCGLWNGYAERYSRRHPRCPLVEIPTPHGRLIDATFEENHYASMLLNPTPDVTWQDKHNAKIIIDALRMAKTVIEAEGEK